MHLLMANQVLTLFIKQLKNVLWSVSAKDIPKDNATRSSSKTNNNKHNDTDGILSRARKERLIVFYEAKCCIHRSTGMCFRFPDKLRPKSD